MQRVATVRLQQKKVLRQANERPDQPVGGRTPLGREKSRFLEAFYEHSLDLFVTISPGGKITRPPANQLAGTGRQRSGKSL